MENRSSSIRFALYLILFALFWVFVMLLADSIWGGDTAQWMAIGYVLINGAIVSLFFSKRRSNKLDC